MDPISSPVYETMHDIALVAVHVNGFAGQLAIIDHGFQEDFCRRIVGVTFLWRVYSPEADFFAIGNERIAVHNALKIHCPEDNFNFRKILNRKALGRVFTVAHLGNAFPCNFPRAGGDGKYQECIKE
jgi:hypothetical protein